MIGVGLHYGWSDAMGPNYTLVDPPAPPDSMPRHVLQMPSAALMVVVAGDGGELVCSPALPPFDGICIAFDHPEWIVDERFAEANDRLMHFPAFLEAIVEAATHFTRAELLARLGENGVASGPVQGRSAVHEDAQIRHLGLLSEQDSGFVGMVRQPHPMWHFSDSKAEITTSMGRTGEHTRAVLSEMGLPDDEISALVAEGVLFEPTVAG